MERKIGEIKQVNGEWYQCVVATQGCRECSFRTQDYCTRHSECISTERSDKTSVIFKKLEKVGEPFKRNGYLYQEYKAHTYPLLMNGEAKLPTANGFAVVIKQNKEDMEEKKTNFVEAIDALCKRYNMSDGVRTDFMSELKEIIKDKEKCNLKPFNLEAAKSGKPVCTRDGSQARIICFDFLSIDNTPIIALVRLSETQEGIVCYRKDGRFLDSGDSPHDLMMKGEWE